jgi:hypothetical protein
MSPAKRWFRITNLASDNKLTNNSAYKAKMFTPAFGRPVVEGHFKGHFRLRIKLIIAK